MPVLFGSSPNNIHSGGFSVPTDKTSLEHLCPQQDTGWRQITVGAVYGAAAGVCVGLVLASISMKNYVLCHNGDLPGANCQEIMPPDIVFIASTLAGAGVGAVVKGVNHAFNRIFPPQCGLYDLV